MPNRRTLLKSAAVLAATSSSLLSRSLFAQSADSSPAPLIHKAIPSTGEKIPVIGIGTNHYGVGDDQAAMAPLKETLAKYAELGGGLIDTSPSYRTSEQVIGNLIEQLNLGDQFFMSTKCDQSGGNNTVNQIAESTEKLKSGPLDLVSIHNLKSWQNNLPVLREAKEAGKIRYYGITTSRGRSFDVVADIMESEPLDFVQLNYALNSREAEKRLLNIAMEKEIAVMVNTPFSQGRLFSAVAGHDVPVWAAEFGATSWGQVFLKYIVSHPAITCAIPGTTKVHHLVDNVGAAQGKLPTAEQRIEIEKYFASL